MELRSFFQLFYNTASRLQSLCLFKICTHSESMLDHVIIGRRKNTLRHIYFHAWFERFCILDRKFHCPHVLSPLPRLSLSGLVQRSIFMSVYLSHASFSAKSAIASDILICCGQTASQLRQPMQAEGCLSAGTAASAIGAMNPPPVKLCSL